jgi:hypothetical protein
MCDRVRAPELFIIRCELFGYLVEVLIDITAIDIYIQHITPVLQGGYSVQYKHGSWDIAEVDWVTLPVHVIAENSIEVEDDEHEDKDIANRSHAANKASHYSLKWWNLPDQFGHTC